MIRINAYAGKKARPWLFDDLKRQFERVQLSGVELIASDAPLPEVDGWINIRTSEIGLSPDTSRTVTCIHDLYDNPGMYLPGGDRYEVTKAGGIVFCHPQQKKILEKAGISWSDKKIVERPLGALSGFSPASHMPEQFTIAWIGRNFWRKRIEWFLEAIQELSLARSDFQVLLLGADLEEPCQFLEKAGITCQLYRRENYPIETYPAIYKKANCLVISSLTEAGPLTLFEALASGLAVVGTSVGWIPFFNEKNPKGIKIAEQPQQAARAIETFFEQRQELFEQRYSTSQLMKHWNLESWFMEVVKLASQVVKKNNQINERNIA